MVKLAKNEQNLHSDYEPRGRGKRTKSSKRLFDDLDSECSVDEDFEPLRSSKKKSVSFPDFPSKIKGDILLYYTPCLLSPSIIYNKYTIGNTFYGVKFKLLSYGCSI